VNWFGCLVKKWKLDSFAVKVNFCQIILRSSNHIKLFDTGRQDTVRRFGQILYSQYNHWKLVYSQFGGFSDFLWSLADWHIFSTRFGNNLFSGPLVLKLIYFAVSNNCTCFGWISGGSRPHNHNSSGWSHIDHIFFFALIPPCLPDRWLHKRRENMRKIVFGSLQNSGREGFLSLEIPSSPP
jgi:hypothetical protein